MSMAGDGDRPRQALVGTSGWQYDSWAGPFYQGSRPTLEEYAQTFRTVEVNSTFYGLPDGDSLDAWRKATERREFTFSLKASRYLTHMKKLKDPAEPLHRFLDAIAPLESRVSTILFQLPPRWSANPGRLRAFLDELPTEYRYAFEFRDHSWYTEEVCDLLRGANAAFCVYHLDGHLSPKIVTADFVYIRLHGSEGKYRGSYSTQTLAGWAGAIASWRATGRDVFVYFDNDQEAAAPADARRLLEMVG